MKKKIGICEDGICKRLETAKNAQDFIGFIKKYNEEGHKRVKGISKDTLELIMNYEWPGNVRELENAIERVIALTSNEYIQPEELPIPLTNISKVNGIRESILTGKVSFLKAEEEFEKGIILDALKKSNYVQSHAAEMLGISRRILKYKMDKLGILQNNMKNI